MHVPPQETYAAYLKLDVLLSAQVPRTTEHDEVLFIIQHQTSELWLKLMIHELDLAVSLGEARRAGAVVQGADAGGPHPADAVRAVERAGDAHPFEYLSSATRWARSSGFQSWQYRAVEFALGNRARKGLLAFTQGTTEHQVRARLSQPSLYDEFLRHLKRRGHAVPAGAAGARLHAAVTERHPGVVKVFQDIYQSPERAWDAYEMCEKLVDMGAAVPALALPPHAHGAGSSASRPAPAAPSGVAFSSGRWTSFFPEL